MTDTPDTAPETAKDYRDTVFLPKTDFPMKAGLAQKEPAILANWEADDLYGKLRAARAGRERWILHDGPPYANGDIHMGHAMNKVLKDIIVRSQSLIGHDAPYVPGWDCHGLPIEWKVEEAYRAQKLDKDQVPVDQFRAECRAYAQKWVDVQREQFKRLGIMGDWDDPYLTMKFDAEATIVGELLKFAESGQLYRGAKPVMWSPVEKTALAEAEVEYEDIVSTQIDVAFEIVEAPNAPELVGAHAVIWTTTPWTIPVNQALAYGPEVEYRLFDCLLSFSGSADDAHYDEAIQRVRQALPWYDRWHQVLVATELADAFAARLNKSLRDIDISDLPVGSLMFDLNWAGAADIGPTIKGSQLAGAVARHPMHKLGGFFAKPRPFLAGDFVTTDAGTGLVHMAPDHGEDDFLLCKANGIDPVFAVDGAGMYRPDWAWLGGQGSVINKKFVAADGPICTDLREAGALLAASDDFSHSYPHSWRSKAKVIFRCTPQWFIPMDKSLSPSPSGEGLGWGMSNGTTPPLTAPTPVPSPEGEGLVLGHAQGNGPTLREIALDAIEHTRWVPERSKNRINAMVADRPDWVISRQRAWGVPIALYVDRKSGQYLIDAEVNARIVAAFEKGGADAWFGADHQALLGPNYDLADYEVVNDILDVWFDSGSTHSFVVEARYGAGTRADLYVEGSDQHRGWFQSSLLENCGTRGQAPYDAVLTHGFALDGQGRKMSKSLGNTVDPLKVMSESGADILRWWAASTDYFDDVRIGKEVLAGASDTYRKLRNTFRYLLGALEGFTPEERVSLAEFSEVDRYALHYLGELDRELKEIVSDKASEHWLEFGRYTRLLADYANIDLSAFYFDIRKDCLYCDIDVASGEQTLKRRSYRTVLDIIFHALVRYAAPILPFTAEEVWQARYPDAGSVHLLEWPSLRDMLIFEREGGPKLDRMAMSDSEERRAADVAFEARWAEARALRTAANEAIEPLRREKVIRSSLEAVVTMPEVPDWLDFAELCIVAEVRRGGDAITVVPTEDHKCGRCWRHLPEVEVDGDLCDRCSGVLGG